MIEHIYYLLYKCCITYHYKQLNIQRLTFINGHLGNDNFSINLHQAHPNSKGYFVPKNWLKTLVLNIFDIQMQTSSDLVWRIQLR